MFYGMQIMEQAGQHFMPATACRFRHTLIVRLIVLHRAVLAPTRPYQMVHIIIEAVLLRVWDVTPVALRPKSKPRIMLWEVLSTSSPVQLCKGTYQVGIGGSYPPSP